MNHQWAVCSLLKSTWVSCYQSLHFGKCNNIKFLFFECCLNLETDAGHFLTLYFHVFTRLMYSTNNPIYFSLVCFPLPFNSACSPYPVILMYSTTILFLYLWFVFPCLLLSACSPYPLIQLLLTVNILQNKKLYDWFSYVHYKVYNHDKLGDSFPFSMKSWGVAPHAILDQLHSKYKNFKLLMKWSTVLYESHISCKTFCWKTFLYKGSVVILALYAT